MKNNQTSLTLHCNDCGCTTVYTSSDLKWENNGPDEAPDYYVECKTCGAYLGTYEELKNWIDALPEYEPDPDLENDLNWEITHGMQ